MRASASARSWRHVAVSGIGTQIGREDGSGEAEGERGGGWRGLYLQRPLTDLCFLTMVGFPPWCFRHRACTLADELTVTRMPPENAD
eukprot:5393898-Prymnesium_polylepis.1